MQRKHIILASVIGLVMIVLTAAASAYVATNMAEKKDESVKVASMKKEPKVGENIRWNNNPQPAPAPQPQRVASNCSDGNIVGTVIGGAAGGIAGNQIGKGNGNTAATIGGAIAGGYLGNQFIPTHNALCP